MPADNATGHCYSSYDGDQEPFRNQTPLFIFGCVAQWL